MRFCLALLACVAILVNANPEQAKMESFMTKMNESLQDPALGRKVFPKKMMENGQAVYGRKSKPVRPEQANLKANIFYSGAEGTE